MKRKIKRIALILAILAVAVVGAAGLSSMKPPPEKQAVAKADVLVEVLPLEHLTVAFTVQSQGNVRPRTETVLMAEVPGTIVSVSPKFVAGGVFAKGEELMRIDPTTYAVAVDQAQATLQQRQIEFEGAKKLKAQGYRAEAELAAATAALETAKADLVRARRNLERSYIRLPYDGMVRSKEADLGQFVSAGTRLGVTFATDYAEVRLPLTEQDLAFVDLPAAADIAQSGAAADGPAVELSAVRRGRLATWSARITRSEGVVEERNRLSYAVARVEDPYALDDGAGERFPLPVGTFVSAHIAGTTVKNVIRVPRTALRGRDELIFVDDENRLRIRTVEVLRTDARHAYIAAGAEAGERITLTAMETPLNGMKVRTGEEDGGVQAVEATGGGGGGELGAAAE